jgi:SAM-dependent methyltransferase
MARNPRHDMLPAPTHDEAARQQFTLGLKDHIRDHVRARMGMVYERRGKPRFVATHGRDPQTPQEIGTVMWDDPLFQAFSRMHRDGQEMMWDSVAETLYRSRGDLSARYRRHAAKARGSLALDPDLVAPRGMAKVDIHLQPGGYMADYGDDDVLAGAFYEYGGNLYAMGRGVGVSESKGEVVIRFIRERYPDFVPTRILDIGCSAGSSSVPYALAFPDAEVHAIDVAPAILRYAHARAEAMGAAVHFHQRDAADTRFPDGSFDLVLSHNAMHEFPEKTTAGMMKESHRLLKPGGLAVHLDVNIRYAEYDAWYKFYRGWDERNNNEPYWTVYATNDPGRMLREAGFPSDAVWVGKFRQLDDSLAWFIAAARKPA